MTTATQGEEYKVLKQKQPLMKAAGLFFWIWLALVTCPSVWFVLSHAGDIREFAVVTAVGRTNRILTEQYSAFTDRVLKEVKIEKYTSKIKIPEVKLDKQLEQVNKAAEKTKKVTSALSKLGVKEAAKVENSTELLQKQVDKANQQIKTNIEQIKNTLDKEVQAGLKKEIDSLAGTQIKKQLALSDASYNNLTEEKYGIVSQKEREITKTIYTELAKNKNGIFKDLIAGMEKYYKWIMAALVLLIIVITMIPPILFKKIAKKLSATFTQCPHCGKIFVSKENAFNILKMLKP
ncbi:MAG: hypothetical protein J5787_07185 [Alphaproteobacteria bacterium]|nr:hypothetical protein [Alphaproteobacteria bacterium]